jgi:glycosyltransferase involved in cell wall biosynthesis
VTALAGFVVYCTNSRTGFLILGVAAVAHAVLLWWRARRARSAELPRGTTDLPDYGGGRSLRVAAAVPFLVLLAVVGATYLPKLVVSHHGGSGSATSVQDPYLTQERYAEGGVTSGRLDTWRVVWSEWRRAPLAEQIFGDATTTRAVVRRASSGNDIQLTTDNAAVGAFRHAGVAGLLAFLLGLGLLLRHALRRDVPAWFLVAVLASLPPVATSDALLGGTGGTIWVLLLAAEARLLSTVDARRDGRPAAPAVHRPDTEPAAVASPDGQHPSLASQTMPSIPEISVVIPTRGRPPLVTRAVRSALGQTFRDIEVLVVVDGPDEPTHAALAGVDDPRLRVVGLPAQGGAPNARNSGVRAARGRWVAFLDDDDEWLPEKLSVQHDLARGAAAALPIVISCLTLKTPRAEFTLPRRLPDEGEPLSEWFSVRRGLFHGDGFIQTSTIMAPTELLVRVPFTVGLRRMQELDWGLRALAEDGTELVIAPQPLVIFNADEDRPRISLESPWREMLEWLRRSRGLVTPRAYAALAMSQISSMAATTHSPRVCWTLLREAHRHGRPHPMEYLTFAQIWLVPGDLRRRVRDLFSGRHGTRAVAARPEPVSTVGGAG